MPGIQQLSCLCENGPLRSSSEHRQLSCGLLASALYYNGDRLPCFRTGP